MSIIDYTIIALYIGCMILIGLYFQKKASSDLDSYFLGGKKLPWWVLGASGMASNLDISGTMINVAFIYALGVSGFFIELRGGIVLIMAFLMVFMGKWNRRSEVMTMAEWMELRFGNDFQGKLARIISAIANLLFTIGVVSYFAMGAGKFIGEFLGIPPLCGFPSQFWAATIMIALAMIYTVSSGLFGVVWTDVFQGVLIFITIAVVCVISVVNFEIPDLFSIAIPLNDGGFSSVKYTKDIWTSIIPKWELGLPENSGYSIYNLFGIVIIFYFIKTIVDGSAGTGGYMIQRYFASRSDREAGLLSMFWIILLSLRWPFVAAIAIMGIVLGTDPLSGITDPESVLPIVINRMVPVGLKGLLIAGLMAAGMSTFDSVVNSGAAYWVKDIYQTFINKDASNNTLIWQSKLVSIIIVVIGLFFTLNLSSINDIYGWLTMSIGAGLIIPMLFRWYWWRLNGFGFAIGTLAGMTAAIFQKLFFPGIEEYISFMTISLISVIATIAGTLLTPETKRSVLTDFYKKTKPFGFWKKIRNELPEDSLSTIKMENKHDIISLIIAIPWQLTLFLTAMFLVIQEWSVFLVLIILLSVLSFGLYHYWYKHLDPGENP